MVEYKEYEAMHVVFGRPIDGRGYDCAAEGHLYNDLGEQMQDIIIVDNGGIFEVKDFRAEQTLGTGRTMRDALFATGKRIFDVVSWLEKYDSEVRRFQQDGVYSYLFLRECALNEFGIIPEHVHEVLEAYRKHFGMEDRRY